MDGCAHAYTWFKSWVLSARLRFFLRIAHAPTSNVHQDTLFFHPLSPSTEKAVTCTWSENGGGEKTREKNLYWRLVAVVGICKFSLHFLPFAHRTLNFLAIFIFIYIHTRFHLLSLVLYCCNVNVFSSLSLSVSQLLVCNNLRVLTEYYGACK